MKIKQAILHQALLAVLFFMAQQVVAQHSDVWQWNTISVEKKLTPKLSIGVDEEIRFFKNLTAFNLAYTNLGVSYKITKVVKVGLNYRFTQKLMDEGYISYRHRVLFDLTFKGKKGVFVGSYRSRLQSQVRDYYSSDDGHVPENYWRHKFDLKFDFDKKVSPYLTAEFRYQFGNNRLREANYMFDRGRYYIGMEYAPSKRHIFGLYYMLQREFNVNDPERDHVIGLSYTLSV